MAKHYNPSITSRLLRIFNFKGAEQIGSEVSGLVAVVPVTPVARICQGTAGTAATNTIYTTPTDKDFYLTAATLSYVKDASSTATLFRYRVFVNGVQKEIITFPAISLVAGQDAVTVTLDPPLKLDPGTIVVCTTDSTVANVKVAGNIVGYTEEVTSS